ncbi:MAG: peptide-binding protein [Deltaproteobacteria bacterium CG06_land_8_20_14_3_00_44_19]|nr:MAG: peptide-binding protein [Deltaproteobacteria bacterium CG06_land_8_20_14_3_00_44_19]
MIISKSFKTLLILFALLGFLGCSSKPEDISQRTSKPAPPAYGDILIDSSIGDASNLIPMLSSDSASHGIAGLIFNGLVKYDKDLNLVGDLAESWDISEDGLAITFHLRKGVRWHDGAPFTANDVMFGYKTIINPNTRTAYAGDYLEVKDASVLDKYTFRVSYSKPFAPALGSWGNLVVLPEHLLKGKNINTSDLSRHPIGTGPYKFKSWKTGEKIELVSNHDYFEGRPYIDGYVYRIIPDPATTFLELKAGGIDRMGLTPLQYERQTDTHKINEDFNKHKYLAFVYTYLAYNLTNPKFKDKRVRQAISYAIDKTEIINGILLGLGEIATGPYKSGTWQYNPNVKGYQYNPEKAKRLLAEAGWKDSNSDGALDKDGVPFEFTIITNQGNAQRAQCAEIIQRRLMMVGIKVKIRIIEWAAFVNDFIDKRNFEAVILGWTTGPEPDIYDIWHSSKTRPKELNFISYKNREVDELLLKGRHTFNREERKRSYFRIQEILAEDQPYTFLYIPYALPIIHKRFKGIKPAPIGIDYNFIKWYVPKAEQKYRMQE